MSSEVLSPDEQVASTSALADLFEKPTTTTRGAKYSCNVCAKQFRSKYTRDDHELSHTDEKPFICETCGMKFSSRSGLGLHTNIHLGKYVCSICGKACQSPGILQSHEASHRGEKEHSCPKCERKFSQKSDVTRHALTCGQTMTNSPESYKLACEQCGKRFKTRDVYRHHMNLHLKRFKCDICDRNCNSLYALRKHKQTHTGQKDFFCDHCGRGFINKTHKIRHEKKCALLKNQAKSEDDGEDEAESSESSLSSEYSVHDTSIDSPDTEDTGSERVAAGAEQVEEEKVEEVEQESSEDRPSICKPNSSKDDPNIFPLFSPPRAPKAENDNLRNGSGEKKSTGELVFEAYQKARSFVDQIEEEEEEKEEEEEEEDF